MNNLIPSSISWLAEHPWISAVIAVPDTNISANALDDSDDYYEIEEELMKKGTLQHGDIRWDWLATEIIRLLGEIKDFRLIISCLTVLPNVEKNRNRHLPIAVSLLSIFLITHGTHGKPEEKTQERMVKRTCEALLEIIKKGDQNIDSKELHTCLISLLEQAGDIIDSHFTSCQDIWEIIQKRIKEIPLEKSVASSASSPLSQDSRPGGSIPRKQDMSEADDTAEDIALPEFYINTDNERKIQQGLVSVADFLLESQISHPISYRLRRYATWYGINSAPPIKNDKKTVMQSVSIDIIDRYQSAIEQKQTDFEIVSKLERSCHLQPFWIEGQFLAYQLAIQAERSDVANAILQETHLFICSIPELEELSFSDGKPFLPDHVLSWINSSAQDRISDAVTVMKDRSEHSDTIAVSSHSSEYVPFISVTTQIQNVIEEVNALISQDRTVEALLLLETEKNNCGLSKRQTTIWEIITLEILDQIGMKSHVLSAGSRLMKELEHTSLKSWEPELFNRMSKIL